MFKGTDFIDVFIVEECIIIPLWVVNLLEAPHGEAVSLR